MINMEPSITIDDLPRLLKLTQQPNGGHFLFFFECMLSNSRENIIQSYVHKIIQRSKPFTCRWVNWILVCTLASVEIASNHGQWGFKTQCICLADLKGFGDEKACGGVDGLFCLIDGSR